MTRKAVPPSPDPSSVADIVHELMRLEKSKPVFQLEGRKFACIPEDIWAKSHVERVRAAQLRKSACGRIWIGQTRHIVVSLDGTQTGSPRPSIASLLTPRELEIARLVAQGEENKQIARRLGISQFTVREHVRRIFHKLGVTKRAAIGTKLDGRPTEQTAEE